MIIQHETAGPAVDFPVAAEAALQHAAHRSGLDARGARLIRLFATAVYHLPAADAVARIALVTSPDSVARLETSVQVTRWLTEIGFPSVEPLPVEQPVACDGCVVTFWRYLPQDGPEPVPADLGRLLRRLHGLGPPPIALAARRGLVSYRSGSLTLCLQQAAPRPPAPIAAGHRPGTCARVRSDPAPLLYFSVLVGRSIADQGRCAPAHCVPRDPSLCPAKG